MPNDLVVLENALNAVRPRLEAALGGHLPVAHLIQTVLVSCERVPQLLHCSLHSILNSAMTFACLGLPIDGATGQGFLVPYKGIAQPVIGYKGYNTLAARSGLTITSGTVREDDEFDFERGSSPFIRHRPRLGSSARIIAFWSCATSPTRSPIIEVLSIDEVMKIKASSAAVKAGRNTPWNDPHIGFPAMGEKSARRRLVKSLPFELTNPGFHLAARVDEAFDEQGKIAYITPEKGVVVEGEATYDKTFPDRNTEVPSAAQLTMHEARHALPTDDMIESWLRDSAKAGMSQLQKSWEQVPSYKRKQFAALKDEMKNVAAAVDD